MLFHINKHFLIALHNDYVLLWNMQIMEIYIKRLYYIKKIKQDLLKIKYGKYSYS